jgi:RNA polymerase sigma-70 factor (ECF subfamily)
VNQTFSDQEIIDRVLQGDTTSYTSLVDKYQNFVYTLTQRILLDEAEAEEAAQDAFIKCYQALKSFTGKSKFSTWLYRIAFNTAISYKRKHRIEVSGLDGSAYKIASGLNTSDELNREEQKRFINNAINRLSPADAAVITLFYKKELTLEEITEVTGMKNSAVKVKLFRARKRLADELKRQLASETESLL